ncbi:cystatin-C-like [Micropterus salmoides]|uniref:cystatin-C-like n=1 Tax=Micropterus salmoides TaxID=27706 RepID=UPI0018EC0761|nr:cystatin-C-like [Micropterus salmoides]
MSTSIKERAGEFVPVNRADLCSEHRGLTPNRRELTDRVHDGTEDAAARLSARRSGAGGVGGPRVGGVTNINKDDPDLQKALLVATNYYNTQSKDPFLYKISSISKARSQVVEGTLYIVDLVISRTVCRKPPSVQNLSKCNFQAPRKTLQCHVEVLVVPWQKKTRTLEFSCKA